MKITLFDAAHVNFTRYDPVSPRSVSQAGASAFDFVNGDSDRTLVQGSDLRYGRGDANGPTRGEIERVTIFSGIDDEVLRITGSLDADDLPGDAFTSVGSFWETVLAGRTTIDLRGGLEDDVIFDTTVLAGDGLTHEEGDDRGAKDRVKLGDTAVTFYGDVWRLGIDAGGVYRGGDDRIRGGANPEGAQTVMGDVEVIFQGNELRGGDDRIAIRGAADVYGDAWRMIYGGSTLKGGDDVIEIGGGAEASFVAGDVDEVSETNLGASRLRGGDDVISVGDGGSATVVGDVRSINVSREGAVQRMGHDEIRGGDGDDTLIGDVSFFASQAVIKLGRDDIRGGDGDDVIHGDVASIFGFTSDAWFRGGHDTIRDGRGDDEVYAGTGDDVVIAGGGRDIYDGGAGDDRLSYRDSRKGVRIDLRDEEASRGQAKGDTVTGFERIDGSRRGDDRIRGDGEDNRLRGSGGDDRLDGRGGRDRIDGGRGDDRLDGGAGRDEFIFSEGYDRDVIRDLGSRDTILLDGFRRSEVRDALDDARRDDGDLVLRFGDGDRLIVADASRSEVRDAVEIL